MTSRASFGRKKHMIHFKAVKNQLAEIFVIMMLMTMEV